MPDWTSEPLDQGVVDSRDPTDLGRGEMQSCVGGWYKPGDPTRLWKQNGRTAFGDTGSAAKVKGLYLAGFDSADDLLLALSGTTLYKATAGATGAFSSLVGSLNTNAVRLSGAHYNDKHYVCNGYDRNRVVESDGTSHEHGMEAPRQAPVATVSAAGGAATRPAQPSGDLVNPAKSMDADLDTYSHMTVSEAGSATDTFTAGAWTGAAYGADQYLYVKWALMGMQIDPNQPFDPFLDDTGVGVDAGYNVTIKVEVDTDGDGVYDDTPLNATYTSSVPPTDLQYVVASGLDPDDISVKITLTYNGGTRDCTLRIYDVRIQDGSAAANFSTTTGIYYAVTEYDQTRGDESPHVTSELVTLSTQNQVSLNLDPAASGAVNSRATHWKVYRTVDGGSTPHQLGLVATLPIATTTYIDDFTTYDKDTATYPLVPLLTISVGDSTQGKRRFPRDTPPPAFRRIWSFRGFLAGLLRYNKRVLRYCIPGLPGSWPEIYVIDKFAMDEHDELVDGLELGNTCLIAARGVMFTIDDLPRVVDGSFIAGEPNKLVGAPGCVSEYGLTALSVAGESHAAWIAHDGIYITNGATYQRISDEMGGTWEGIQDYDKSGWVLSWDRQRKVLIFSYSNTSGGENDRYALFHMAPEHRKPNGLPKVIPGNYGEYNHVVAGYTSSAYRVFSAHPDDGVVYLEDNGTTDAASSYNSAGDLPWIPKSRRIYGADREFSALKAKLRHSDWGTGQTVSLAYTTGRDTSGNSQTRTQTVDVSGRKGTLLDIARGGEWHEFTITHTAAAVGAIQDLQIEARGLGGTGKVAVA